MNSSPCWSSPLFLRGFLFDLFLLFLVVLNFKNGLIYYHIIPKIRNSGNFYDLVTVIYYLTRLCCLGFQGAHWSFHVKTHLMRITLTIDNYKTGKNIWNNCFMTFYNTKHKNVILVRKKTIKMSSVSYSALCWVEISELWQMEWEPNFVWLCRWVEETKMKTGEAEVSIIWRTEYQTRECCYTENDLWKSLCVPSWLFISIPTWIYIRWNSLRPGKE